MLSSCVCLSLCLSNAGIVPKRLNIGSCKQRRTASHGSDAKDLGKIPTESPLTGAPNRGGVNSNRQFSTSILLYLKNGAR